LPQKVSSGVRKTVPLEAKMLTDNLADTRDKWSRFRTYRLKKPW